MRRFLTFRLLLAGAVLSLGLIAAAATHIAAVASGTEVIIPAQAFDPRALLTGHYAQLRYAISQAELETVQIKLPAPDWRRVWVTIVPLEEDWKVAAVTQDRPSVAPPGGHILLAETMHRNVGPPAPLTLRYGIERIYAQQSEAEAIDRAVRTVGEGADARLKVVASLGGDGRLRVKALIMGGQRTDFGWW